MSTGINIGDNIQQVEKKYCAKCDAYFFGKTCPGCGIYVLTAGQSTHLTNIIASFKAAVEVKYRKGAEEHGGNLFDLSSLQLVENAIEETIDQYVYLFTLREKLTAGTQVQIGVPRRYQERLTNSPMRDDVMFGVPGYTARLAEQGGGTGSSGGIGDPSILGPATPFTRYTFTDRERRTMKEQGWTCDCVRPTPEQGWPFIPKDRHTLPGYAFSALTGCTVCGGDGIQKHNNGPR